MRLALLACVALAAAGCRTETRDEEVQARDESSFITLPSGVGDQAAVYMVNSDRSRRVDSPDR